MPDTTLQTTPCFADLPEDVLVQIFQWLSAAALLAVERTRKSFRDVVRHHDYLFLKIYGEGPVHRRVHDDERDATTSRQLLREKYEWRQRLQTKDAVQMTPTDCIDTLLEKFYLCDDATLKGIAENVLFSLQEHRSDTVDYHEAAATALAVLGRKEEAAQNYDTILRRNETLPSRTILTAARFGWPCLPFLCFDADQFKGEALLGAAVGGQLSMLQELISIDAPLDYSSHGLSVALAAAMGGHTSILEYVQGAGVNLTSRASQNAETPLYYAAKYDNADAARYILAYTNEAEDILDAFDGGVISGSLSVLETLAPHLHHLEDALISRFLKTACCSTTTVALHFLLVDQKMDANHLLEDGSCAVHLVAKENKLEHLTVLLECGASILPMDATGQTALEIALSLNHTELIEFLVQVSPEYGRNGFTHQEKLKYVEDCLDRLRPLYLGVIVMGHRSGSNEANADRPQVNVEVYL
ncbi:uncharacterized protein HMPREF1541_08997 [Cyphellophora europaea CBS 101466]|uniref:F-box domain-containing protein n=1 Tax=Cyphellophora europaea (strain CBS 101466) TaxID=1220924 RepID=W2RLV9_CYPE1|nr:uncharacterized protein HMPREF1541_08997 [Cyphellophora europaea CBS 101466]ETN36719.1 hypothetical protein HMPREF1541_08997 [Cyphellophora europaea CBS 101466]